MDIYAVIKTQVVDQMTPVIELSSIETLTSTTWKLYSCNTEWLTVGMTITIAGNSYKITAFVQDEYLTVKGTVAPVQLYFQVTAPHFEYGNHRKTNIERGVISDKKLITPFVYMPFVQNTGLKRNYDSPFGFEGDIRLFFLHEFDKTKPTRVVHTTNIINPMKAMADYAMTIIDQRQDIFDDVTGANEIERMDFGDITTWGGKERVFDEDLSGAERSFELRVTENEVTCGCCLSEVSNNCMPVNFLIDGVQSEVIQSGTDFDLNIKNQAGATPDHSYDAATDTLTVQTGGGSCDPVTMTFNTVPITSSPSGGSKSIVVRNSELDPVGFAAVDTATDLTVNVGNSEVEINDSAGGNLYMVSVKAEGAAVQVITDHQTTINTVPITPNKAETNKAITIRYANNDPVVVTTITDTETLFVGEIPDVVVPLNYATTFKDGQTTSFVPGDAGDVELGEGVDFFTLSNNNVFGNTNRFTAPDGTQTYGLYICDHACRDQVTGRIRTWHLGLQSDTLLNHLAGNAGAGYTNGGLSGWHIPSDLVLGQIYNREQSTAALNYAPFNINANSIANSIALSNTFSAALGLRFTNSIIEISVGVGNTMKRITYRDCTEAELATL